MRPGKFIELTRTDRDRLNLIVHDRNAPRKHVARTEIVLLSDEAIETVIVMRRTGDVEFLRRALAEVPC